MKMRERVEKPQQLFLVKILVKGENIENRLQGKSIITLDYKTFTERVAFRYWSIRITAPIYALARIFCKKGLDAGAHHRFQGCQVEKKKNT